MAVRDQTPPYPKKEAPPPEDAYVKETLWPRWQGSPTEIARLATRAEEWMNKHFIDYRDPRYEQARRLWPRGMEFPQLYVFHRHVVKTAFGDLPARTDGMRDEIEARRSQVRLISIQSSVIDRTWKEDVFERVSQRQIPAPEALAPVVSSSFEIVSPPERIELVLRTEFPAVRLRVTAAGPEMCGRLYEYMAPHVEAGSRPRVWDSGSAGLAGVLVGVSVGACFYPLGVPWLPVVVQIALGAAGWLAGHSLARWAFPPLELLESWESSRWKTVRTYSWQSLLFVLGVAGVVVTVLLAT